MRDVADPVQAEIQSVFSRIYQEGSWGRGSGPGSNPEVLGDYRLFLERFIRLNGVRTIVDVGCGDWQFSRFVDFGQARYLGLDVVDSVLEANTRAYGSDRVEFRRAPGRVADIPSADLLIMKDVLQHLPDPMILEYKALIRSRFRYALLTNSFFKGEAPLNTPIAPGDFRCLDLQAEPYRFGGAYVVEQVYPIGGVVYEHLRALLIAPAED